jgi:hypothetical protein
MRERLMTLACALAALFLFGTLFLQGNTLAARRASLPTTIERADNGLLGLASWLKGEGVPTVSLRERFGALEQHRELAGAGNLLIVSLPAVSSFRRDEAVALDRWISNGNTLLVLAALRDRPGWAQSPWVMRTDLELLTELSLSAEVAMAADRQAARVRRAVPAPGRTAPARPPGAPRRSDESGGAEVMRFMTELTVPERSTLVPNRAHPFFSGVARAVAFSDYAPLAYSVALPRESFALSLAHESATRQDAFWILPRNAGTIIVCGFGSLFSNRALGTADNARLLANVIAATVAADGTVVFDDEHQGLSDAYDPARFYRDARLYATLGVMAAVWLVWVLGGTQLRMPLTRPAAPREAELVRTTGLFLARVLQPAAAARRMFERFLQRLGSAVGGDPAESRLWDWLENHPRLARAEVRQLREWRAAAGANRRVPLMQLHNLIVRTERQLAQ